MIIIEFFKCVGVFVLVFCVVFGFLYILFGEEQALKIELKKISDDNDRRAAETIRKQNEELERIRKGKEEIKKIFENDGGL